MTRHEREQIGYAPPELVNRVLHLVPLEALALVPEAGIGSLAEAQRRGNDLNIRIRDLERYGRALLLDGTTANGKRVMMWAE